MTAKAVNPSRIFILRPVATALFMAAILLVGLVAYSQLAVSALPEVSYPTIQVKTLYPGASADVMSSTVTAPLERQFGQMQGLSQMTSTSSGGASVIVLQFTLSSNIDVAEQEVQAAINSANTYLPTDLPTPPVYSKTNPADAPVLTLALTSQSLSLSKLEDLADSRLGPKISQLSGVGLVTISGGQKPAIRIQANPLALSSYGLSLEDVRTAISSTSVDTAKGSFDGPKQAYTITANDQLTSGDDYKQVIVAYRDGAPIKLSDVAKVVSGVENDKLAAWMNDTPAVILNVQRQSGANTIQVVDGVKKLLPSLQSSLPAAVQVHVLTDMTTTIRASVADVRFELILTVFLVVLVIYIFLRSFRATIIPAVAVPLSIVGTFATMYALGYSLNNLTLMALTISTGFVVDDAIVMIENINRYLEEGMAPLEAALKGAEQIGFTIVSLTVSLVAVLIPLLLMGDITGRLFREFAVTLAVTIIISAVVSLTLTPMMAARLLRYTPPEKQGRLQRWSDDVFHRTIAFYGRTLRWVLRHQTAVLLLAASTLVLTIVLYILIPKGFFPVQDTGVIQAVSQAPESTSFEAMQERQRALAHVILADPAVSSLSSFIGIDGVNTTLNSGRMQINLKPLEERGVSATEIINRLKPQLDRVSGIRLYLQPVQDLTVENRVSRTQYQYTIEDPDQVNVDDWTTKLVAKLNTLPELTDVATDQQPHGLAADLHIDRVTASRLSVTPLQIDNMLYDAFGQRQVTTLYTQTNQYHVILEADPEFQTQPNQLNHIYLPSTTSSGTSASQYSVSSTSGVGSAAASTLSSGSSGSQGITSSASVLSNSSSSSASVLSSNSSTSSTASSTTAASGAVPIAAVAQLKMMGAPLTINHQGQFPVVTISFNVAPGSSLGAAIKDIEKARTELGMPVSVQTSFQGTAASFKNSLSNEGLLVLAALVTVYIVLGVLYESFIHPITILSTLPSAGVGALLALRFFGYDLGVVGLIGIVLLIGIVKKNGIMMIDFALDAERSEHLTAEEAVYQACLLRFRPILMTTMAALLAAIPLAFMGGIGSELRRPLGIVMIGGLVLSQILTFYTTPVIYIFFDRLAQRFRHGRSEEPITPLGEEPVEELS
ncbi:MAG: efflux RND transporter permease subunit [Terracidiphilus sp.]|nr:efflux RND transporter permease subunit [Terracidiphilus sp.]